MRIVLDAREADIGSSPTRGSIRLTLDVDRRQAEAVVQDTIKALPADALPGLVGDLLAIPGVLQAVKDALAELETAVEKH